MVQLYSTLMLAALTSVTLGQLVVVTQITSPVEHAEGPYWNSLDGGLNFVDINDHKIYFWNASTGDVTYVDVGGAVGFAIPVQDVPGRFIAGRDHDLVYIDWFSGSNETVAVADQEVLDTVDLAEDQGGNRWNDAKADVEGRLWAGTMGWDASLYSLETRSTIALHQVKQVTTSNGIAWNSDNTMMYYIDTPTRKVDGFEFYAQAGVISSRRTVFDFADHSTVEGSPDGMTIDTAGNLWVALWGGNGVIKVNPATGQLLQFVQLPANQVTSVAWGDADLSTLYVTTSRAGLTDEQLAQQPLAGAVFAVTGLGARGLEANSVVRVV